MQVVEVLLSLGAAATVSVLPSNNSALHLATYHGCVDSVRALLRAIPPDTQNGQDLPNPDVLNKNNDTPLMFAAANGHAGVMSLLLKV
jgi:ankyrin repeat protein